MGKSPCISRLGRCWPRLGGQSSQARAGGVEKANEKGGYVEGRVREGKWPRFRKTQDTTKHKQTVVWFPSFNRQVYFCYGWWFHHQYHVRFRKYSWVFSLIERYKFYSSAALNVVVFWDIRYSGPNDWEHSFFVPFLLTCIAATSSPKQGNTINKTIYKYIVDQSYSAHFFQ